MSQLYPYQQDGVEYIERHRGRVLIADEQGLGKTIQVLEYLRRHAEIRPVVIVCPASVKYVWEEQAWEHCGLRTTICSTTKPPKSKQYHERDIFIINYDILGYWCRWLRGLHPRAVVFDEVHKLKSRRTWRTRAARQLCAPIRHVPVDGIALTTTHSYPEHRGFQEDDEVEFIDADGTTVQGLITSLHKGIATIKVQIPHLLGLSGTPLTNRPEELWTTLNLIWPSVFPAFEPYGWEFCEPEVTPYGVRTYHGAANLDKLHRMLNRLGMLRRRKRDVLQDLPAKQRIVVPLDLPDRREYVEAQDHFLQWLSRRDTAKADRARQAEKITQMMYLKRLAAQSKLPGVFDWIDDYLEASEDKLVIGCWHHDIIDAIHARYPHTSLTYTGKTPTNLRRNIIRRFRSDGRIKMIIGQIQAIGIGVDGLQSVSHTSIMVELPWDPGTLSQFDDRIHRIGQTRGVTIYYLVARNTIESRLCHLIQSKQKILTEILDGTDKLVPMQINIYDQLIQEMQKEPDYGPDRIHGRSSRRLSAARP